MTHSNAATEVGSGYDVPETGRAPYQRRAPLRRNNRQIVAHGCEAKCDEIIKHGLIQRRKLQNRHANRLQRFPLIRREVVVNFVVHAASTTLVFAGYLYKFSVNAARPQCVEISIRRTTYFESLCPKYSVTRLSHPRVKGLHRHLESDGT